MRHSLLLSLAVLAIAAQCALAIPPVNNECSNAIFMRDMGMNTTIAFTTQGATTDGPADCPVEHDIWYCFTPKESGVHVIDTCAGTTGNTYVAVYDSGGNGCDCPVDSQTSQRGCNDDYCGLQSRTTINAVAARSFLIRVGTKQATSGAVASGILSVSRPIPRIGSWCEDFDDSAAFPADWYVPDFGPQVVEQWRVGGNGEHCASYREGVDQCADHTSGLGRYVWMDDSSPHSVSGVALYSPNVDVSSMTTPELSFWIWDADTVPGMSMTLEYLNGMDWVNLTTVSGNGEQVWRKITVDLAPLKTQNGLISQFRFIGYEAGTRFKFDFLLDDVCVRERPIAVPTCSPMPNFPLNTTSNGALVDPAQLVLSWTHVPDADSYSVYFGTDGSGTALPVNILAGVQTTSTAYDVNQLLDPSAVYYWAAVPRNELGAATGCSIWSFSLLPPISSFPACENFDSSAQLPAQWVNERMDVDEWNVARRATYGPQADKSGSGRFVYVDDSAPHAPNISLYSPPYHVSSLQNPVVEFWYWNAGPDTGTSILHVDVTVDYGMSWFLDVGTFVGTGLRSWVLKRVDLSGVKGASPSGNIVLRFRGEEGSSFNIDFAMDEICITEAPTTGNIECSTALTFPTDGQNSVDPSPNIILQWAAVATAAGYDVNVGTQPTGVPNNIVNDGAVLGQNNFTLPPLTVGGTYRVQITPFDSNSAHATNCPTWSFTLKPPIYVNRDQPFHQDWNVSSQWPKQWQNDWTDDGGQWFFSSFASNGPMTDHSGVVKPVFNLYFTTESTGSANLVSPPLILSNTDHPELTFWYFNHITRDGSQLILDVSTDGLTWTNNVGTYPGSPFREWKHITVDLTSYRGSNVVLRFRGNGGNVQVAHTIAIDDLWVREAPNAIPSCVVPDASLYPPLDATGIDPDVLLNFSWSVPSGAPVDEYLVHIGADGGGSSLPMDNIFTVYRTTKVPFPPSLAAGELTPGVPLNYYWSVIPKNVVGSPSNCPIWTFSRTPAIAVNPNAAPSAAAGTLYDFNGLGYFTLPKNWLNDRTDGSANWVPARSGTSYANGPARDHTNGNSGNYLYARGHLGIATPSAQLISPTFDLSAIVSSTGKKPRVTVWVWNKDVGEFLLYVDEYSRTAGSPQGSWRSSVVTVQATDRDVWTKVELFPAPVANYAVRFRAVEQTLVTDSAVAIDDFSVDAVAISTTTTTTTTVAATTTVSTVASTSTSGRPPVTTTSTSTTSTTRVSTTRVATVSTSVSTTATTTGVPVTVPPTQVSASSPPGLSGGAIAGIVIACLVAVGGAVGGFLFWKKRYGTRKYVHLRNLVETDVDDGLDGVSGFGESVDPVALHDEL